MVRSNLDAGSVIQAEYGFDAFGTVAGLSLSQFATIHSAIEATDENGTLNLRPGTFRESAIVIDKTMTFQGRVVSGVCTSVIVTELTIAHL